MAWSSSDGRFVRPEMRRAGWYPRGWRRSWTQVTKDLVGQAWVLGLDPANNRGPAA